MTMPTEDAVSGAGPSHSTGESDALDAQLATASLETLAELLKDPRFGEEHLLLLLGRANLPALLFEEIIKRRDWLRSYKVKRAIVFHVNVPRPLAPRLLRDLHLMDLVKLANAPAAPPGVRRAAEENLIGQLPRLPVGQKIALARQASAQVLGALLAEGHKQVVPPALDNPRLTEAQVLKTLAREKLGSAVLPAISRHSRWACLPGVRLALLRHSQLPLEAAIRLLAHLSGVELRSLGSQGNLSASLRRHLAHEIARHAAASRD
jgi:hypothetical protein